MVSLTARVQLIARLQALQEKALRFIDNNEHKRMGPEARVYLYRLSQSRTFGLCNAQAV